MASRFDDDSSLFNFVVKDGNGVKGLVDLGLTEVPRGFIQPPHLRIHKPQTAAPPENMTIDLSELDGPNHNQVVKAIAHAAETLGFFQVVNHGVPLELLDSLKVAAHQFFNQSPEKKAVYLNGVSPSPLVNYGTGFNPGKEKILLWVDYVNMRYMSNDADALKFWPNEIKEVTLEYIKASKEMVNRILEALITSLGVKLDDSTLDTLVGYKAVRMCFYPPCPNPELTVGGKLHSDFGTLTVLLQDDIGGLHVKKGESSSVSNVEWIEIPPIDGALVINVGDMIQILSNGKYKSVEHIVQTTSSATRVSLPLFCVPLPMAKIGPLPELVARDGVARYREVIFQEYMDNFLVKDHGGKKPLDFASL